MVLRDTPSLLDEAELVVERNRGGVVGEDIEAELVQTLDPCPLDRRGYEGRPDATSAPLALDEHCELADSEAALANVDHPDDRAVGLGDKGACRRRGELVRAGIDVDGRLRRDPVALLRHRREQLGHLPRVFGTHRSNLEFGHRAILALEDRDRHATRQATYRITRRCSPSFAPAIAGTAGGGPASRPAGARAWPANDSAVRDLLSSGDRKLCLVERK